MRTLSRDQLQAKLDVGDVELVVALHGWANRAAASSAHFSIVEETCGALASTTMRLSCAVGPGVAPAGQYAYHALVGRGYANVRRYAGRLSDWLAACPWGTTTATRSPHWGLASTPSDRRCVRLVAVASDTRLDAMSVGDGDVTRSLAQ